MMKFVFVFLLFLHHVFIDNLKIICGNKHNNSFDVWPWKAIENINIHDTYLKFIITFRSVLIIVTFFFVFYGNCFAFKRIFFFLRFLLLFKVIFISIFLTAVFSFAIWKLFVCLFVLRKCCFSTCTGNSMSASTQTLCGTKYPVNNCLPFFYTKNPNKKIKLPAIQYDITYWDFCLRWSCVEFFLLEKLLNCN